MGMLVNICEQMAHNSVPLTSPGKQLLPLSVLPNHVERLVQKFFQVKSNPIASSTAFWGARENRGQEVFHLESRKQWIHSLCRDQLIADRHQEPAEISGQHAQ